jgi:bifunctional UDP-N-acetylglucosamine pyrophosphorylase/glucosamine-1-phosphate N-acetyltransferase
MVAGTSKPDWTGVVLAAGKGVRMKSATPKTLHRVCGVPMLAHVVEAMRGAGASRIVAVASPALSTDERFIAAAGAGTAVAVQKEQLGTADALMSARSLCAGAKLIVVGAGDMPLVSPATIGRMVAAHNSQKALLTLLYSSSAPVSGMGRVRMGAPGIPVEIIEEKEATPEQLAIANVNTSWYCFDPNWLWQQLPSVRPSGAREAYLTDLVALAAAMGRTAAVEVADPEEALGVNDRSQLARAESAMRRRIQAKWMAEGVTFIDPSASYVETRVVIGQDTVIQPGVHLRGDTRVGANCEIGPDSVLTDSTLGDGVRFIASHADGAVVGNRVSVGPFSRLRPGAVIDDGAYIGNFAEVKNSRVGSGTHIGHFSYVGDSVLGREVNIGAGVVTVNFDGRDKHRTTVEDGAFIGSGTMLIAPRTVRKAGSTGAGSIVTHDVGEGELVIGNPARPHIRKPRPGSRGKA